MATPFICITSHRVDPERRPELEQLSREYTEFLYANEPDLLAHYSYFDESRSELSLVQVHRDAASAERHMQLAGQLIRRGVALTPTVRFQVYGEPGPAVSRSIAANEEAGVRVVVASAGGDGFTR
jgi:hypothetical protein